MGVLDHGLYVRLHLGLEHQLAAIQIDFEVVLNLPFVVDERQEAVDGDHVGLVAGLRD